MSHPEQELNRFYDKIRLHLDDLELKNDVSSRFQSYDDRSSIIPSEGEIFGSITKDEFIKILNSYEEQQGSQDNQEKPVACDKVVGGNYAKLLYSKVGFHHLGSTSHLAKSLEIRNVHGNSFLGGHSTFCPTKDEELDGLNDFHLKMSIKRITDGAIELLDKGEMELASQEISKAYKKDPVNVDVLFTCGRYHMAKKEYSEAIGFLKRAFSSISDSGADDKNIKMYLSDSYYHYGFAKYSRREYKEARLMFLDALQYNPDNQGAKLHRDLCENALKRSTSFSQAPPAYRK